MGLREALLLEARRRKHSGPSVAAISPAPLQLIQVIAERLATILVSTDAIIELGCGDAQWATHVQKATRLHCAGVDCDTGRLVLAQQHRGTQCVELLCADMFSLDYSLFSVALLYLSRAGNAEVQRRVLARHPNIRIVVSIGVSSPAYAMLR